MRPAIPAIMPNLRFEDGECMAKGFRAMTGSIAENLDSPITSNRNTSLLSAKQARLAWWSDTRRPQIAQ